MNTLEYCVFALMNAVKEDKIGKAELVRRLDQLLGAVAVVHEPYPNKEIKALHDSFHRRFDPKPSR